MTESTGGLVAGAGAARGRAGAAGFGFGACARSAEAMKNEAKPRTRVGDMTLLSVRPRGGARSSGRVKNGRLLGEASGRREAGRVGGSRGCGTRRGVPS